MTNLSKSLVLLFAALGAGPALVAQQPANQAQATAITVPEDEQPTGQQLDRLFEVMRTKAQMTATTKMLPQIMQQQFERQIEEVKKDHPEFSKLTPEQQQAISKVIEKFMTQAMNLYTADEMVADMRAIYQRHLTGSDVENLITFYSSPSGQHMLDMIPVIMQEFMPVAMEKMQSKMRPLIAEMAKEMAEISQAPGGKADKTDQPQ